MKKLKNRISAVMALMLAGTILASASTPIPNNPVNEKANDKKVEEALVYDEAYLEEIDAYVEQYLAENIVQFQEVDFVKVYDSNQELLVEGEKSSLGEDQLRLLRQADLLSELNGTAYYQINN
ncbi:MULTISPECIES: hypothetical protein [Roseivirga]|jgi:hypothetical protein|uniref:DUF4440 domain-containing protein n=1 Tax=Roseivirga spongicola TaxID=333140 RepID=A0A150X5V6_9BACT|nr:MULTISPECIES: hypothetical protein [Roseivirga]KYG74083.1 hypothetical protein AWW68_15610 [Roseivirga spongicola]MBO6495272.1 hypothetical protein [Roseivirga sp.]WPZ09267.1 hypothetical protein T7867_13470 [Roseivirga spongicola]